MGVEGYDKVYTKVIEGKPKCVYKRPNGTKHYVLGFGKMRTIENYVKLCRKKAVEKAAKSKKVTKKPSTRKRYGGFFAELFTVDGEGENPYKKRESINVGIPTFDLDPLKPIGIPDVVPNVPLKPIGITNANPTTGGNSCNRSGQRKQQQQLQLQQGGKRKKKNASNKSLLKMMMAAFKNKSVKKSKSKRRHHRGGEGEGEYEYE